MPGVIHRRAAPAPTLALALFLALALTVLFATPALAATWYEAYHEAEAALEAERWSEAVGHLNAALEARPSSGARVRTYGMRFVAYFPYLELGIAYYHLGQAEAALQAFETEQRQGEIAKSADDAAVLERYRERIRRESAAAAAQHESRARDVVAEGLAEAEALERAGRYEDALAALSDVLAVMPEQAAALAGRERLLAAVAAETRARQEDERHFQLVAAGEAALGAGRFRVAAARFSEALELRREPRARALLEKAQAGLRAELEAREARQGEETRRQLVAGSLARAGELERGGELEAALAELQAVLALDSANRRARALQARIVDRQAARERSARDADAVASLLAETEDLLAAGDHRQALRRANRVLALEPANDTALRHITRAYAALSDHLLDTDDAPPAIVLAGDGQDADDHHAGGTATRVLRESELVLAGSVYDSAPAAVRFFAAGREVGEATVQRREFQGVWITDFRWRHRMPPGRTAVEVVAVDDHGNEAAVAVAVEYRVPFMRSWRLPASLGGGLALAGCGLVLARSRRRKSLLRARFNPYVAGAPILEQERFFGRAQLLDYVLRRVSNNSIMLYGERRIGKTSFQHRLKRCLATLEDPDHEFFPVFIDLQGTPQEKFFATLAAEIFHELAPKLGSLQPQAPPSGDAYGYRELVKDLHRVLEALRARSETGGKKVKLVLLIDEVDELNAYDPRINQRLRSLFMRAFAENLVSVVSGVAIQKHWEREGSPWYNFFQEIEVEPLDAAEARALIEAPVRGIFAFEDGVADAIVRRTGAKPYLIQRLCSALVDRMHEEARTRITMADVEAACRVEGL